MFQQEKIDIIFSSIYNHSNKKAVVSMLVYLRMQIIAVLIVNNDFIIFNHENNRLLKLFIELGIEG